MPEVSPSEQPDCGHDLPGHAQAAEAVVSGDLGGVRASARCFRQGPATHPGFGAYETAWTWLHKLRKGLVDQGRKPLSGELEIDEGFIRGTRGAWRGGKSVVLVAAQRGGRIRLRRVANNDEPAIGCFADALIDTQARVISDGLAATTGARSRTERTT